MALKPDEIRNLSEEELKIKYNALTQELFGLKQQAKVGKLEKPAKIWQAKKDIARVMTILKEKGARI